MTCIHKANIMKLTDGLFLHVFREVAKDYPTIEACDMIVDACCMNLVLDPTKFDVMVTENLYGDIVTDLTSGLIGGVGLMPSANIGTDMAMFEAVHGSAPDIAGKNLANPTAFLWSACMMLDHIGLGEYGDTIREANKRVMDAGIETTRDIGGSGKSYVIFLLGLCILLAVNYSDQKLQNKLVKKHAPAALSISATLFAAGAMVGVFDGTGMLEAMANAIMSIIPAAMGQYIHIIFGILALPLGLCVGTDAYFYGIMPLVMKVGETYGVASLNTALTMLIGKNLALMVSPLVPATYLAIGLTGTELKDHMKFSIPPYYLVSMVMLIFGIVLGIIAV